MDDKDDKDNNNDEHDYYDKYITEMDGLKMPDQLTEEDLELEKIFCCIRSGRPLLENLHLINTCDLKKDGLVQITNANTLEIKELMVNELYVYIINYDDDCGFSEQCLQDCPYPEHASEFTLRSKSKEVYMACIRNRFSFPNYSCESVDMSLEKATCVYGESGAIDGFFELIQSGEIDFPFHIAMDFEICLDDTVLYNAMLQKNSYGVKKIIEYLASVKEKEKIKKLVNAVGKSNEHILHLAARLQYKVKQIFQFAEFGANLNWASREGNNFVHIGLKYDKKFADNIVRYEETSNYKQILQLLVHLNSKNEAPLFSIQSLNEFFFRGPDGWLDYMINEDRKETILFFLAKYDTTGEFLEYLLKNEIKPVSAFSHYFSDLITLRSINADGITPLLSAMRCNAKSNKITYMLRWEHFSEMKVKAIETDWKDDIFNKLLDVRKKIENFDIKGCIEDPNDINEKYMSFSFYTAIIKKDKDLCRILLSKKACPSYAPGNAKTPVMLAGEANRVDILAILKEYEVDFCMKDKDGNTVWHYIAENNSPLAADYIINSTFGTKHPKQIILEKNSRGETALDIAIRKEHGDIVCKFIPLIELEYFNENPDCLHRMWRAELYDPIAELLNHTPKIKKKFVELDLRYLDYFPKEKMYGNTSGTAFSQTLLHKIFHGEDEKLKYHPVILATVDNKISVYRWVRLFMLILYIVYLVCFGFALFEASYTCGDLLSYGATTSSIARLLCEIIVGLGFVLMVINEVVEFILESLRTIQIETSESDDEEEKESEVEDTSHMHIVEDDDNVGPDNAFLEQSIESTIVRKINRISPMQIPFSKLYELPRIAFFAYLSDPFNLIDSAALSFVFFWMVARLSRSELQWTFASIALSLSVIVLLKFSNIFPKQGAYVNSILIVFTTDLPRFFGILIIFFIAYIGGIHLAARQQPRPLSSSSLLPNSSYIPCPNSETFLYWFSEEQTVGYDLKRPLLSSLVLFLDGGVGNNELNLFEINAIFSLVYIVFALIISVVMANLLIAQLSKTYEETTANSEIPYKFEIVFTAEYQSNYNSFFRSSVFKSFFKLNKVLKISIKNWRTLVKANPFGVTPDYVSGINLKISQLENSITQQTDEIRAKVNEIQTRNDRFFTEFSILRANLETKKLPASSSILKQDCDDEDDENANPTDTSLKDLKLQVVQILESLDKVFGTIEQLELQTKP